MRTVEELKELCAAEEQDQDDVVSNESENEEVAFRYYAMCEEAERVMQRGKKRVRNGRGVRSSDGLVQALSNGAVTEVADSEGRGGGKESITTEDIGGRKSGTASGRRPENSSVSGRHPVTAMEPDRKEMDDTDTYRDVDAGIPSSVRYTVILLSPGAQRDDGGTFLPTIDGDGVFGPEPDSS